MSERMSVSLLDLFGLDELQNLQEAFSAVAGVAAVITMPDGTPVTQPSRFTNFCLSVRATERGCARCVLSDAAIGRFNATGPTVQACLSGGLLDAGVAIRVGTTHIGNWLIGQVRGGDEDEETLRAYARHIGVDEAELWRNYLALTIVPKVEFERIAGALFTFANNLSERAYAKVQQARLEEQLLQSQKMELLGKLASGISHDVNNVLAAISAHATAKTAVLPANHEHFAAFDTIAKASSRGGNLLRGWLSFARQTPFRKTIVRWNDLVREEMRLLEKTALAHVRLQLDLQPDLWTISGDEGTLAHAVMNVLVNAKDALGEGGSLTIRTRNLPTGWVQVEVTDDGPGMEAEVLQRALDPFFTTKQHGKGTGLGLWLVSNTIRAHEGKLEIDSTVGVGTRICMSFPASVSAPDPELS